MDLEKRIKSELSISAVRTSLNKYNEGFSEDTQRGTDRLIRVVIQDISELGKDVPLKSGKARSETKVEMT